MARTKGAMGRNKRGLLSRLKQQYGDDFHPIMKMAENAVKMHNIALENNTMTDYKISVDAWSKVAEYTEPKLRAMDVDVTSNGETVMPTRIELVPIMPNEANDSAD